MRAIEPWVEAPLSEFLDESGARIAVLMTGSGQVAAQHGFTGSLDLMTAAALTAAIMAATAELFRLIGNPPPREVAHQGESLGIYLAALELPRGRWIGLVVYGRETSLGLVQLFFGRMEHELRRAAPLGEPPERVLPGDFEAELDLRLKAIFGR